MKNPKKKGMTVEEKIKSFEEFSKRNEVREITKEEFEQTLKKGVQLKTPKDNQK